MILMIQEQKNGTNGHTISTHAAASCLIPFPGHVTRDVTRLAVASLGSLKTRRRHPCDDCRNHRSLISSSWIIYSTMSLDGKNLEKRELLVIASRQSGTSGVDYSPHARWRSLDFSRLACLLPCFLLLPPSSFQLQISVGTAGHQPWDLAFAVEVRQFPRQRKRQNAR